MGNDLITKELPGAAGCDASCETEKAGCSRFRNLRCPAKWFKYITPGTWSSNDLWPAKRRASRGQKARDEIEAAPLPVKIHS
jgi:hypothetical protein